MIASYVVRGTKAGIVAGVAFGAFVALVGNPLVGYAETFEEGGHVGGPIVSGAVTAAVSVVGGALFGMLLGAVVLGAVFYFLEPSIPGEAGTKSYLLAAAGFVTVSGVPWLALPPQPPGVEGALPVETRLAVYLATMIAGALACGLAGFAFNRLRTQHGRALAVVSAAVPFVLVVAVAAALPANPVSGPIPEGYATVFRAVAVVGQVGLWFVLASVHAWLLRRERDAESAGGDRGGAGESTDRASAG